MSEFKGTPGPWSFNHNSVSDEVTFCINVVANGVSEICYLQSHEEYLPSRVHTVANANLIAASPDLLKELEETHAALCFTPDYVGSERYERNKLAIAKALGQ